MSLWHIFYLFGWLVGFLTSSSTTRLYRGWVPRQSVWQFYVRPHMRQRGETNTSVSGGHIILALTQPVGSGRPQRESNPEPPHQESRALPTKLPPLSHTHTLWHMRDSIFMSIRRVASWLFEIATHNDCKWEVTLELDVHHGKFFLISYL